MKTGDFVSSMGKPGIVVDVFTSESGVQSYIKLLSPDLITRNVDSKGELVDIGYHVNPCDREFVIKVTDDYIKMLNQRIEKLEQFKRSLLNPEVK